MAEDFVKENVVPVDGLFLDEFFFFFYLGGLALGGLLLASVWLGLVLLVGAHVIHICVSHSKKDKNI